MTEATPESLRAQADEAAKTSETMLNNGAHTYMWVLDDCISDLRNAASEIERLQAENTKLEQQFQTVAGLAARAVTADEDRPRADPFAKYRSQTDYNAKPNPEVAP